MGAEGPGRGSGCWGGRAGRFLSRGSRPGLVMGVGPRACPRALPERCEAACAPRRRGGLPPSLPRAWPLSVPAAPEGHLPVLPRGRAGALRGRVSRGGGEGPRRGRRASCARPVLPPWFSRSGGCGRLVPGLWAPLAPGPRQHLLGGAAVGGESAGGPEGGNPLLQGAAGNHRGAHVVSVYRLIFYIFFNEARAS